MTMFACTNPNDEWDEELFGPDPDPPAWTHEDERRAFDALSDHALEWQGLPIPIPGIPLVLQPLHPLKSFYDEHYVPDEDEARECSQDDVDEEIAVVNRWHSRVRNCEVIVLDRAGRRSCLRVPKSPDGSMDRLTMWMQTMGASDAWDENAEHTARVKLRDMVTDRQYRHYDLTGSFMESSPRSGLTYVFRRLRPTIALSMRGVTAGGTPYVKCLAVLCLHPIGFYDRTWAGCMVPTDDVIAHLTMMRGDEAHYWGQANKHAPSSPEAGL